MQVQLDKKCVNKSETNKLLLKIRTSRSPNNRIAMNTRRRTKDHDLSISLKCSKIRYRRLTFIRISIECGKIVPLLLVCPLYLSPSESSIIDPESEGRAVVRRIARRIPKWTSAAPPWF
uniref:Uncharacterized protein n=1 Tax=Photinus pyralis TaxID=7054 RepID=A0A1Y1KH50_PHOPY